MPDDLGKTASLRMHITEVRVVSLYPLPGKPAVLVHLLTQKTRSQHHEAGR
jgi:hypothetical protein